MAETAGSLNDFTVRKQKVSGFSRKQQYVEVFYYQLMHKRIVLKTTLNFNVKLKLFLRLFNCATVGEKKTSIIIKVHGMNVKTKQQYVSLFVFLP